MSLRDAMPAEVMYGCTWADDLVSADSVVENGGTINGTPTFSLDGGVVMDGSTDYLKFDLDGSELRSPNRTVLIWFKPATAYDTDVTYNITDATGDDVHIFKRNNASSNVLRVSLGGVVIADIPSATYSPYWVVGEWSLLVVSGTSGNTNAWINGVQVLTADASAWSPLAATSLWMGSTGAGANTFNGSLRGMRIFSRIIGAQEAIDYYNNTTFNYVDRGLVYLPMRMQDHDPTAGVTKNRGSLGSAADAAFPGGVADPTKSTHRRGYTTIGDYFVVPHSADFLMTTAFTVGVPIAIASNSGAQTIFAKRSGFNAGVELIWNFPTKQFRISADTGGSTVSATSTTLMDLNRPYILIATYDGAELALYVDGVKEATANLTGSVANSEDMYIMKKDGGTTMSGRMDQFFLANFGGNEIQVQDLYLRMKDGVNVL